MKQIAVLDVPIADATERHAASGDELAFERLITEHHASMARVAYAIAGDAETAAEAVQAAWSIAWLRLHHLRDQGRIGPWLVSVTANETRQLLRKQRRRAIVEISVGPPAGSRDPATDIDALDLGRALRKLSPDERSLLALRYAAGLDSTQIGAATGMSASGVRTRLARVLQRLRVELDDA